MSVLITNGEDYIGLACVRSLGKRGIDVTAASNSRRAISFYSRYCCRGVVYPSAETNLGACIKFLLELVKNNDYKVLIPGSDVLVTGISKRLDDFRKYVRVPIPNFGTIEYADDKSKTMEIGLKNDIPIPRTYCIDDVDELREIRDQLTFPVVIKPYRGAGAAGISYPGSWDELIAVYVRTRSIYGPTMVQEKIRGQKYACVLLFNQDHEPRRVFVHRTYRQYPVTGGTTTYCRSVAREDHEDMVEYSTRLLKALGWYGIAEIEFIVDERDGTPKLLEINPRPYGPIQLAVSAGVDFPYLLYRMALEGDVEKDFHYKVGVKLRWFLFGDVRYFINVMRGVDQTKLRERVTRFQTLVDFLKFYERDLSDYILSADDPAPAAVLLWNRLMGRLFRMRAPT
jgi:predicted ATP-grasp superfamily ATP-dependent carboligase